MIPGRVSSHLISIIVPVYNEEATIGAVVERVLAVDLPAAREVIVVNDGSRDGTPAVLDVLGRTHPDLVIVHVPVNQGKGHAVRLGITRTRGTVVTMQDADLELDPAEIAGLVAPILDGAADVVYGSRFMHGYAGVPGMTRLGNRGLTALTNVLYRSTLTDMETCYKVMRGDIARGLTLTANRFDIEPEITARLLRAGWRIVERPVAFQPRSKAAGKKMRWRDGWQAIRTLVRCRF